MRDLEALVTIGHAMRIHIEELLVDSHFLMMEFPKMVREDVESGLFGSSAENAEVAQTAIALATAAEELNQGIADEMQDLWDKTQELGEMAAGERDTAPPGDISAAWGQRLKKVAISIGYIAYRYHTDHDFAQIDDFHDFVISYGPLVFGHAKREAQFLLKHLHETRLKQESLTEKPETKTTQAGDRQEEADRVDASEG
ncbi:hypothetical protein ASD08_35635 [Streptomyces sp. Root369]|nr:hypothetical protein ASD08_35635 [Streptomyces sp. Root369]